MMIQHPRNLRDLLCAVKARIVTGGVMMLGGLGSLIASMKSPFIDTGLSRVARLATRCSGYGGIVAGMSTVIPLTGTSCMKTIQVFTRVIGTLIALDGGFIDDIALQNNPYPGNPGANVMVFGYLV